MRIATIIDVIVSLMPFCRSSYLIPKHQAMKHITTPSAASTILLFTLSTRRPMIMIAIPTISIAAACQGLTIFLSDLSAIFCSSLNNQILYNYDFPKSPKMTSIPIFEAPRFFCTDLHARKGENNSDNRRNGYKDRRVKVFRLFDPSGENEQNQREDNRLHVEQIQS